MKKIIAIVLLVSCFGAVVAQKHDYVWVVGDDNQLSDTTHGGSTIDFKQQPPTAHYNYRELNFRTCNASICDTAGNLLFYTNGCSIAGADDQIIEGGEGLNLGNVYQSKCQQEGYYTSGYQSALILPMPDSSSIYYLFHKKIIYTFDPFDIKVDKLFYSKVDISQNGGAGKVVAKNVEIMSDDIAYGQMTAVKHANGKDWWLVTPKDDSNTFYTFLLTKEGIVDTLVQSIGIAPPENASGGIQICFSPDGNRMFRSIPRGPVLVYQFNRSLGILSGFDTIHVNYTTWLPTSNGCSISPNNRFLYVCAEIHIFQFDLWATDISSSQQIVAEWDGFADPVGTIFGQSQLGPDCKIYISTVDSRYYHVIQNPDEPGDGCDVDQHSFVFPTPTGASIPSFPNYRLGPLGAPGLPCTATVGLPAPPPALAAGALRVWPNPASEQVTIAYNTGGGDGLVFVIFNAYGQAVKSLPLHPSSEIEVLPVGDLSPGIYFYRVENTGTSSLSGKIVVQH
jgi:hypothetical protein